MTYDPGVSSDAVLYVLIEAIGNKRMAAHMNDAYSALPGTATYTDEDKAIARYIDSFICLAIEAGVLDAEQHWNSEAWSDMVEEVYAAEV